MRKLFGILACILFCMNSASGEIFAKDFATKEADYLKRIEKDRIKEEYGRKILEHKPSGYMTVEEYELLSQPKDKAVIDYGVPQLNKPGDLQYVPQPTYKITRYNNPPGTPNLTIRRELFQTRQLNLPGITSPDFSIMVYPAVYYYPVGEAVTCDLFVIPLKQNESNINKILKANIANRLPEPIMSTDTDIQNSTAHRTLTPIDFSSDSKKLLIKEKIGSSEDGIWKTNIKIYDFTTKTSYDLVELRYAVEYYWSEYKGLDLQNKRWDLYPLGFSKGSTDRIIATGYAYTGNAPIFLGVWSIDTKGEQSRLISLTNGDVEVESNGFKVEKSGVVSHTISEFQEKVEQKFVKNEVKREKAADKDEVKSMKNEMKAKLKEVNTQFKLEKEEYDLLQKIQGSTSENDSLEKYNKQLEDLHKKREQQQARKDAKAEKARLKKEAKEAKKK